MRIGVDVREFRKGKYTGLRIILGNFLSHAKAEGHEFVFFGNRNTDMDDIPASGEKVVMREFSTFLWDQVMLPAALRSKKVSVFFSPYIKTPFVRACPYVNTVCDVIPLMVPKFKGIKAVLERWHFFAYSYLCGRRAVKVLTLSRDARERISKRLFLEREKVEVAYPSIEAPAVPAEDDVKGYDLSRPYLLYVGNFKPHKNLGNLISAYECLPEKIRKDHRMYLVGGSAEEVRKMNGLLESRGLGGRVVPVGNLDNEDVFRFYAKAACFVFPSLAEGFGMPPVEAMAAGVPVLSSALPPMTEVLGDAAVFFDPYDPKDISRALTDVLSDEGLRKTCVARGHERSARFNAKDMSRRIMDILEEAGGEKTLLVSSEFPPIKGGISTMLHNLWSRVPRGDAFILTSRPGRDTDDIDRGLDIVRKVYPLGKDIISRTVRVFMVVWHVWRQNCLRRVKRNHCAQVISAGIAGLVVKIIKGTPYVVYAYSADILEFSRNFATKWIIRHVMRGADQVIVCSKFAKALTIGHDFAEQEDVTVITPGVNTEVYTPLKDTGDIREKYGLIKGQKVLLSVSRLSERKGHENVIKALPDILEAEPHTVYVITGGGEKRAELEALVAEMKLEDNVIFAGEVPQEDLVKLYNTCDIFILLPRYLPKAGDVEGFGIVFLEANACGKPVIAGDSGGVSEAVMNKVTGLLVDPVDTVKIADSVERLLRDKDLANDLGRNGLARVRMEFGWDIRARELRRFI